MFCSARQNFTGERGSAGGRGPTAAERETFTSAARFVCVIGMPASSVARRGLWKYLTALGAAEQDMHTEVDGGAGVESMNQVYEITNA